MLELLGSSAERSREDGREQSARRRARLPTAATAGFGSLRRSLGGRRQQHRASCGDQVLCASCAPGSVTALARNRKAGLPLRGSLRGPAARRRLGGGPSVFRHGIRRIRFAWKIGSAAKGRSRSPRPWSCFARLPSVCPMPTARGVLHCDLKPANILLDQDSPSSAGRFRTVPTLARATCRSGNALLHGPGTGRSAGRFPMRAGTSTRSAPSSTASW